MAYAIIYSVMDVRRRALRRTQLDRQLSSLRDAVPPTPKDGWVHTIREAVGMSLESLGSRLGVSRQTAYQLEQGEKTGSITLKRLRTAADCLGCELVVVLVPRDSLESFVRDRATDVAKYRVERTAHSMAMESQGLSQERVRDMVAETVVKMVSEGDPHLWD